MKNYIKTIAAIMFFSVTFIACDDDKTELPEQVPSLYYEGFTEAFAFEGWTNFSQAGTNKWTNEFYEKDDNYYIKFTGFQSNQASNIGWAITPAINLDLADKKRLVFRSAKNHVSSLNNKFELFVSEDFDGTNVLAATWVPLTFNLPPLSGTNYAFVNSGVIDLSAYSGMIHLAWKVTGNGSTLTGGYEVDSINVF